MFVYTTVMYRHTKSLNNDSRNLSGNMCEVKYIENFIFIFYIALETLILVYYLLGNTIVIIVFIVFIYFLYILYLYTNVLQWFMRIKSVCIANEARHARIDVVLHRRLNLKNTENIVHN
jgi:hypothetical protein